MVTTGLVQLFEGVTVTPFANVQDVLDVCFTPLLFGIEFNLITIVRSADKEGRAGSLMEHLQDCIAMWMTRVPFVISSTRLVGWLWKL